MRFTLVAVLLLSFVVPILLFAERPSPVPADSLPEKLPVDKIPLGLDRRPEVKDNPLSENDGDRGRFKTPTLRGAALTAPYMHDGSLKTLEEVVEFYNKGGQANPHLDPIMEPLKLSPDDVRALVEFLKILLRVE